MTKRNLSFATDLLLLALLLLLQSILLTGLEAHEVVGIFFAFPLIIHLSLSWRRIMNSARRRRLPRSRRAWFHTVLNGVLFIVCILEVSSGLMISRYFTGWFHLGISADGRWRTLHNQLSTGIFIIASVHIAGHWPQVLSYLKRKPATHRGRVLRFNQKLLMTALRRSLLVLSSSVAIAAVAFMFVGKADKPGISRNIDVKRLQQHITAGSIQLIGFIAALAILIILARRLSHVRQ